MQLISHNEKLGCPRKDPVNQKDVIINLNGNLNSDITWAHNDSTYQLPLFNSAQLPSAHSVNIFPCPGPTSTSAHIRPISTQDSPLISPAPSPLTFEPTNPPPLISTPLNPSADYSLPGPPSSLIPLSPSLIPPTSPKRQIPLQSYHTPSKNSSPPCTVPKNSPSQSFSLFLRGFIWWQLSCYRYLLLISSSPLKLISSWCLILPLYRAILPWNL